jgi:hypothetical protein
MFYPTQLKVKQVRSIQSRDRTQEIPEQMLAKYGPSRNSVQLEAILGLVRYFTSEHKK